MIGQSRPVGAVGGGFEAVAVGGLPAFPVNPHITNALGSFQIERQGFTAGWSGGAPACIQSAVDSIGGEVVFGSFFAGGCGPAIEDEVAFTAAALGEHGGVVTEWRGDQCADLLILCGGGR